MRWTEIINAMITETATGGSSSAGCVAAVVSPLGVGFGTDYSASIYGSPKKTEVPILRRTINSKKINQ